jgi:predicted O-methyltransferase YrrM
MLRKLYTYLIYLIRSKGVHGVHSPFVYELSSSWMRNNQRYYAWEEIEILRQHLLKEKQLIGVTDFGALGKGVTRQLKLADITNRTSLPRKYGQLLFQCAMHLNTKTILELGTSVGIGTAYLASANKNTTVYTLEGCPNLSAIANLNFNKLGLHRINSVNGNFDDTLPKLLSSLTEIDLVYIDGNHTYEATIKYYQWVKPKLSKDALVVIDDIYWSKGMEKAWDEIIQDQDATVTIDLYRMGLVFFKPGQHKEHFNLRF